LNKPIKPFTNELNHRTLPGDYYWKLYYAWDCGIDSALKKTIIIGNKMNNFYLVKVTGVIITINGNSWQTELVTSEEGVPENVLKWGTS
jgi:hypothetical protein